MTPDAHDVLCACGCGQPAPLYERTNNRLGFKIGDPQQWIKGHNNRTGPMINRYTVMPDGCWRWDGPRDPKGYGRSALNGTCMRAHRVMYFLRRGPVGANLHLDHLCNRTWCINPDHLEPVTPEENRRRQTERARQAKAAA